MHIIYMAFVMSVTKFPVSSEIGNEYEIGLLLNYV
jgi:hypothetical protein